MPYLRRDLGLASLVLGSRYRAQTGQLTSLHRHQSVGSTPVLYTSSVRLGATTSHSTVVLCIWPAGLPEVVTRLVRIIQLIPRHVVGGWGLVQVFNSFCYPVFYTCVHVHWLRLFVVFQEIQCLHNFNHDNVRHVTELYLSTKFHVCQCCG